MIYIRYIYDISRLLLLVYSMMINVRLLILQDDREKKGVDNTVYFIRMY